MYVSEKAVEYHLRNVCGKLGISSRRELRSRS
jgi:DNA-binding CsgD family transcriptional regulator